MECKICGRKIASPSLVGNILEKAGQEEKFICPNCLSKHENKLELVKQKLTH